MDFNANNALIKHLKLDEGSPKYNRSFDYNILPFFTRQKERAKFKNGFMPVIGSMARYSLGLKIEYNQEDYDISNIYENVESVGNLDETQKNILLDRLFDFDKISSINHPRILTFQPLSNGSDRKGEVNIALYINKAFDLKNNLAWKNFISTTKSNNLMEKMFFDSIKQIDTKETKNNFVTLPDNLFTTRKEDLEFLLNHKDFALKNLDKFFAFYYFQYITQTVINIDNLNKIKNGVELEPLYFTLDSEKLSSTRITYKKGFNYVKERKKFTLANDNLIGYLNIIIKNLEGTSTFYSLTDILNFDENKIKTINHELSEMMKVYKMRLPKEEEVADEFIDNLKILKKWLIKDLAEATSSRYSLSIDEIGDLYFLKSRGSLGKTLTIRKDILILLTSIIVKNEKN